MDSLLYFIKTHRGKVLGIVLGILFGALVIHVGFWYSVFIVLCALVGLYIGSKHDRGERLAEFFDKIMNRQMK